MVNNIDSAGKRWEDRVHQKCMKRIELNHNERVGKHRDRKGRSTVWCAAVLHDLDVSCPANPNRPALIQVTQLFKNTRWLGIDPPLKLGFV